MRRILSVLCLCALSACASSGGSKAASTTAAPAGAASSTSLADASGTPTTAAGGAPTTAAAAAAATTVAAAPRTIDPCTIVTPADVAAVFGGTVAAGVVNPDNGGCDYEITGKTNTGDSGILTQVSIEIIDRYESYDRAKVVFPEIEKVDGLGSEAWYYGVVAAQLHIKLGNQELQISGLFPGDKAAVKTEVIAFAKVVIGKLK